MSDKKPAPEPAPQEQEEAASSGPRIPMPGWAPEIGGPKGPEPTRYGDWEQKGRCTDF